MDITITSPNDIYRVKKQVGIRLFELAIEWARNPNITEQQKVSDITDLKGRKKSINGHESIEYAVKATTQVANELLKMKAKLSPTNQQNCSWCP